MEFTDAAILLTKETPIDRVAEPPRELPEQKDDRDCTGEDRDAKEKAKTFGGSRHPKDNNSAEQDLENNYAAARKGVLKALAKDDLYIHGPLHHDDVRQGDRK